MYTRVMSGTIMGLEAKKVIVETDISNGLPMFDMVGLLSSEVKEARERVRTAIKNSQVDIPPKRITVNLSPADIRKAGGYFDLPIAVALLAGLGIISDKYLKDSFFIGELGLDGRVLGVKGVLPIVGMDKKEGAKYCFVPKSNSIEGGVYSGIDVIGISNINEIKDILNDKINPLPEYTDLDNMLKQSCEDYTEDFSDISGQELSKRAIKVAVAGRHNIMLAGPPGSGKTMMAKRIPTILPQLTKEECLEISEIYSISGMLQKGVILKRPFRETHHTITLQALLGGGIVPKPGETTLAHNGVLFLDEYPEFQRKAIEVLRQPLEDQKIIISRVHHRYVFPADFQMVCAMNLCPCGHYPDRNKCNCTEYEIKKYLSKISGPILDRIDIGVYTDKIEITDMNKNNNRKTSKEIREEIMKVYDIQKDRFNCLNIKFNSRMGIKEIDRYCNMSNEAKKMLDSAYKVMDLSIRGYHKIKKVARTIADLDNSDEIKASHITEAIGYRMERLV